MNIFTVPAVLTVDNSVVDLETIEALYENVSLKVIFLFFILTMDMSLIFLYYCLTFHTSDFYWMSL